MQKIRKSVYSIIVMAVLLAGLSTVATANSSGGKIDINHATAVELQQLKGVGEVVSQRIVAYRDEKGSFKRIEDIKKVKGIGEKVFEKIKDLIDVGDDQAKLTKH